MEKDMDLKEKIKQGYEKVSDKVSGLGGKAKEKVGAQGVFKALEKDAELGRTLHSSAIAAMNTLQEKHPEIKELLEKSYGFAVIPEIGGSSLVVGGAYGIGEVFVKDHVIGYAAIVKVTLGVQLGGTTFHEMIVFNDEKVWEKFKGGKFSFAADAGVAIVKAGAQASKGFGAGTVGFIFNEGGMLLDLDIGVQKFVYKPTVLGKLRTTEGAENEDSENKKESSEREDNENKENPSSKQRPPEKR
jgi:hypothetical protein